LHGHPLLDEGLRFGAYYEFENAIEHFNVDEESADADDLCAGLEIEVAEGK